MGGRATLSVWGALGAIYGIVRVWRWAKELNATLAGRRG